MFTGIVMAKAPITEIQTKPGLNTLVVSLPARLSQGIAIGASIALNGTCLTVIKQQDNNVYFDVMEETLRVTNLAQLKVGDWVNVERAATFGAEIGGHLLSGHIHSQVTLVERKQSANNTALRFEFDSQWRKYILSKGYIAIDGISLTLGEVTEQDFWVHLIPETLRVTTLSDKAIGDKLNIEIDSQTQAVVDTVERVLAQREV